MGTSLIKPTSNLTSNLAPLSKPLKRSKRQDDDDDDDGNEDENGENKSKLNTSNKLSATAASWSKLRENCKKQKNNAHDNYDASKFVSQYRKPLVSTTNSPSTIATTTTDGPRWNHRLSLNTSSPANCGSNRRSS